MALLGRVRRARLVVIPMTASDAPSPIVLGEVLFDRFPDGREVLGGAPFNVAWHLCGLGFRPRFVSRVGDDPAAARVRRAMAEWGLDDRWVGTDAERATGYVAVDTTGDEPTYDIPPDQAFDRIEPPSDDVFGEGPGLLYHGTLALRGASVAALDALRPRCAVFLDVNLRDPWWERDPVRFLMDGADWVKLNHHELAQLSAGGDASALCSDHGLRGAIVTEGPRRAAWFDADGVVAEVVPPVVDDLLDTVGAGDAFSAVCLAGLMRGAEPADVLRDAARFAAGICRIRGATTTDVSFYRTDHRTEETG